jgi:predicted nucleic acid-binding protein
MNKQNTVQYHKTVILDSSIWLSSLLIDDSNHLEAVNIVKLHYTNHLVYTPDIVFYEVISVLIKLKKYEIAKYFSNLPLNITTISNNDFLETIFKHKDKFRTKTQDSLIIIHCLKYNVDHFRTFDKKQAKNYNLIKSS